MWKTIIFTTAVVLALCAAVPVRVDMPVIAAASTRASSHPDLITDLPGLPSDAPQFNQYSGYLDIPGTKKHYHYWFVESQNDPSSDPILLWLNGGPGCSSLDGYLSENGPFHLNDDATLYTNEYSWNTVANVIYLESPVGVGFTYSDDPADYNCNDDSTADDNHAALVQFFAEYSEFASNDFYIAAESYGGVYGPMLASRVINDQKGIAPLKGLLIGNGASDFSMLANSYVSFAFGHGLFGYQIMAQLSQSCQGNYYNNTSPACQEAQKAMYDEIGDLNMYDVYAKCYQQPTGEEATRPNTAMRRVRFSNSLLGERLGGQVPCINSTAARAYLNTPEVQKALHVKEGIHWTICSDTLHYTDLYPSMLSFYHNTILGNVRVLMYHGDADSACTFLLGESFVQALGLKQTSARRTWMVNEQIAGWVAEFAQDFEFATIRGASHMVPQSRPPQALHMFKNFLANKPF